MLSTINRINERENTILLKAMGQYKERLIKETKGTNYLDHTFEIKYINRLIEKFTTNQNQFNRAI